MFGLVICLAFLGVISAQGYPRDLECFNFGLEANCTIPELPSRPTIITPIIDGGVYPFQFGEGNLGLSANISFTLNVGFDRPVGIMVFDCFCACDTFGLLINGAQPPNQLFRFSAAYNVQDPCETYADSVVECLFGSQSLSATFLPPGLNNITITSARSPLTGGAAYAWIYTAIDDYFFPIPLCYESTCNFDTILPNADACENILQS